MASITDIASTNSDFSTLVSVLQYIDGNIPGSDLVGTLSNPGTYTVFAPTNSAFAKLAADLGYAGDTDEASVITFLTGLGAPTLQQVVLYHVSGAVLSSTQIAAGTSVNTLQGEVIDTTELPTLGDLEPDIINPSLVATDIPADNGVVHVIDRVLLPIDLAGNDAPSITEVVLNSGVGFDSNGGDFDMLREAVVAAGLADTLNDPTADLTVFAPTDSAFVGLSQALGYQGSDESGAFSYLVDALRLLNSGNDPIELLATVLAYHVVPSSLQASQIIAQGSVTTLAGNDLSLNGLALVDAEPDIADPNIILTDIQASNGIIHALDGVLLPVNLLQSDGSADVDFVIGNDDRDRISTGRDNDLIDAQGGNDKVFAGSGNDLVLAGDGRDLIVAGRGDDIVKGEDGNDRLLGESGNDILEGGMGRDTIFGGSGNDTIIGGAGDDYIYVGSGQDVLVYGVGDGHDRVFGFRSGSDKLDISGLGYETFDEIEDMISGNFFGSELDFGDVEITLIGTRASSLDAGDFIFS